MYVVNNLILKDFTFSRNSNKPIDFHLIYSLKFKGFNAKGF